MALEVLMILQLLQPSDPGGELLRRGSENIGAVPRVDGRHWARYDQVLAITTAWLYILNTGFNYD